MSREKKLQRFEVVRESICGADIDGHWNAAFAEDGSLWEVRRIATGRPACPFCGSNSDLHPAWRAVHDDEENVRIHCGSCGALGPAAYLNNRDGPVDSEAEAWRLFIARGYQPPLRVVLHCPACKAQHIDAPSADGTWTNPPHRSHKCEECGCVWRAADVETIGVTAAATRGKKDVWPPRL